MTDIRHLLERQAEWQKARGGLSWPEKIRMAEAMRETLCQFRGGGLYGVRRPGEGEAENIQGGAAAR